MPPDAILEWVRNYIPDEAWQNYGRNPLPKREAQILQLSIEGRHWMHRMETCIQSPPEAHPAWPIMDFSVCQCGRWLYQTRKDQQFDQTTLIKLTQAHEALHEQGKRLHTLYQTGEIMEARAGLVLLRKIMQEIEMLLDEIRKQIGTLPA
jgi:hypothetical protein